MPERKRQAKLIRLFRKIHRTMGVYLFVLFFIVSITGLLLGWKKNSNGIIHPESKQGVSSDIKTWLPLDSLQTIAFQALQNSVKKDIDLELQRIDARPEKGIVKFVFENHYWGIQLDGTTGEVLSIEQRRSDLIENIHDGRILDILFKTEGEFIKLIYTTTMGLALFLFTATGFWLWYGPQRMRKVIKNK
jgi:uncharacterized iron-regulated membrane protein